MPPWGGPGGGSAAILGSEAPRHGVREPTLEGSGMGLWGSMIGFFVAAILISGGGQTMTIGGTGDIKNTVRPAQERSDGACEVRMTASGPMVCRKAKDFDPGPLMATHNMGGCSALQGPIGVRAARVFFAWLGREPDLAFDYIWGLTWSDYQRSSKILPECWRNAGFSQIVMSVPMVSNDPEVTMEKALSGAYDDMYRSVAANLVQTGYPNAIIRLGWEFNIPGWAWSASNDPESFVPLWRHIVDVMRSTPSANFRFDWNYLLSLHEPDTIRGEVRPSDFYPGDAYVDIIGADVYNQWDGYHRAPRTLPPPEVRWQRFVKAPFGLQWQLDFARAHGKDISFPEWGTGLAKTGDGLGDDPYFIINMAKWIKSNPVAYHVYWDKDMTNGLWRGQIDNGHFPNAGEALKCEFGTR